MTEPYRHSYDFKSGRCRICGTFAGEVIAAHWFLALTHPKEAIMPCNPPEPDAPEAVA